MRIAPILLVCVVAMCGVVASSAPAQLQASDPLPFIEFAAAVRERGGGLDADGWDVVRAAYLRYLDRCEAIRLDADGLLLHRVPPPPFDGDVRRWFREALRRVRPQRDLDEGLVETAVTQLPEASASRGPILRAWCERRWLLEAGAWNDRSSSRYVPGALRRARYSDEDRVMVRDAMDQLEPRLAALERKRFELVPSVWQAANEARAALPARPVDWAGDPHAMQDWRNYRRVIMRRATHDMHEVERRIDDTVLQAVSSLLPHLSTAGQRTVLAQTLELAFGDLDRGDPSDEFTIVRAWLRRTDISQEKRDEARAMLERWREEDDRAVATIMRLALRWQDARFADLTDPLPDGGDRSDPFQEQVWRAGDARRARAAVVRAECVATFGITTAEPVGADASTEMRPPEEPLFAGFSFGDDQVDGGNAEESPFERGDSIRDVLWCSAPTKREILDRFLDRFEPEPVRRLIFETLRFDLAVAWSERVTPPALGAESATIFSDDGTINASAPAILASVGRESRDAAIAAKREFFDGVAAAAGEEAHDAVLTWRLADMLGSAAWAIEHRSQLPAVDHGPTTMRRHENVALAVLETDLAPVDRAIAERVLAERCAALESAERRLDDAEINAHVAVFDVNGRLEIAHRSGGLRLGGEVDDATQEYTREIERIGRRLAYSAAERIALADEAVQALEKALPGEAMRRIRRTMLKLAYPGLDDGKARFERIAGRALALETLEPERIASVAEAVERWRDEHEAITDRLAELGVEPHPNESGAVMSRDEHEQRSNWLRFRRDQCGQVMLHALSWTLTDEERREVRGLPKR